MNAANTATRPVRIATPERWAKAAERARAEGVQVRQVASTGQWVATSGSDANVAYLMEVTGTVAHGCSCLAGVNGDPVCKHRAAFDLAAGLLGPEPPPPAAPAGCPSCLGTKIVNVEIDDNTFIVACGPTCNPRHRRRAA